MLVCLYVIIQNLLVGDENQTHFVLMNERDGNDHFAKDMAVKCVMIFVKNDFFDTHLLHTLANQDTIRKNYERNISQRLLKK